MLKNFELHYVYKGILADILSKKGNSKKCKYSNFNVCVTNLTNIYKIPYFKYESKTSFSDLNFWIPDTTRTL